MQWQITFLSLNLPDDKSSAVVADQGGDVAVFLSTQPP